MTTAELQLDRAETLLAHLLCADKAKVLTGKNEALFAPFEPMRPAAPYTAQLSGDRIFSTSPACLLETVQDLLGSKCETALMGDDYVNWIGLRRLRKAPRGPAVISGQPAKARLSAGLGPALGAYVYADNEDELDALPWEPLYNQAALDAAVAAERERLRALVEAVRDANCDAHGGGTFRPHSRGVGGVTMEGNCDLCFLKRSAIVMSLIAKTPAKAVWWAKQEHSITNPKIQNGGTFRSDRPSYAQMLAFTGAQADAFGHAAAEAEDGIECLGCTD